MCNHMGSNIQKNVTHSMRRKGHPKAKTLTIYRKFQTNLSEINLKFVLQNLSSILLNRFKNFMG